MLLKNPSKTFLLGEYLALHGGPSLVITHQPNFQLIINPSSTHLADGIAPLSPAGKYIQDNLGDFLPYSLKFSDPHQGKGGFGASTAQFLLAYKFLNPQVFDNKQNILTMLKCYQHYAWNGEGLKPSGADLIAQATGGITLFGHNPWQLNSYSWPFKEMSFTIVKTTSKLATHHHLAELNTLNTDPLRACMENAIPAFFCGDLSQFAYCVNHYAKLLNQAGLVAKETLELIHSCQQIPGVLATKGCGALGADTLLILSTISAKPLVIQWAEQQNLQYIAD